MQQYEIQLWTEKFNWKNDMVLLFFFLQIHNITTDWETSPVSHKRKIPLPITKRQRKSHRWPVKAAAVPAPAGLSAEHPTEARLNESCVINNVSLIYRYIPEKIKQS